jgi:hypothetical protein
MPTDAEVVAACTEVLKGLDQDTLEYLAGGVVDVLADGKVNKPSSLIPQPIGGGPHAAR